MEGIIKILVADDHVLIRQGLRVIIDAQPDMQLVGEASNGEQAVQQALSLHPDIVIMDLQMPSKMAGGHTRNCAGGARRPYSSADILSR